LQSVFAIGLTLLAPNIAWNAQHGFPTLAHTAANADWERAHYSLTGMAKFALGQFGVFGPILMAGFIAALWRLRHEFGREGPEMILAAFSLPPFLLILIQAYVAGANANWAATAFIAATPLAVAELARWRKSWALWGSFAVDGIAMFALWVCLVWPGAADAAGVGNAFKREEGWRELGREVARAAGASHYDYIAADNRSIVAELLFYARPCPTPIRMWARDLRIRDHFEMTLRLESGQVRVLLAVDPNAAGRVLATFDSAKPLTRISIPVGGRHVRLIDLYDARDYRGPRPGRASASVSHQTDL